MLLSLQSKNESYSKIQSNIDVPWESKYVKYWISSINFTANMYNITKDDIIEIVVNDEIKTIRFENKYISNKNELLGSLNQKQEIKFDINDDNRLTIMCSHDFTFANITPRARMLCGLINVELNKTYTNSTTHIFDIPIFDYANKLYLISKQGSAIHTNIGSQEYSPSIIASIDTVIRKGLPVIVNFETYGKPIKNRINIDSFHYIELELVDMMLNPVVLLSPMFVSIKVKPCKTPIARLTD